jgi:hypothetical protein
VATVHFTANLQRHVSCPTTEVSGETVAACLDGVFAGNPKARGYVLDEHGSVRHHMNVFVDGEQIRDRIALSDAVGPDAEIYVIQALSGG